MRQLLILLAALSSSRLLAGEMINYSSYASSTVETKALVQRVLSGLGGEPALRNVHAVRKLADIDESNGQGGKLLSHLEGVAVFPSSLYARLELPTGSLTAVSTPEVSYVYPANPTIQHAALRLNEEERMTLTRYFYEEPLLIVRNRIDPSYLFAMGPKVKIGPADAQTLYVHAAGMDVQWCVDATGRIIRSMNGNRVTDFSDWRSVNGITVPFAERSVSEGKTSTIHFRSYEINPVVDSAAVFATPTLWITRNALPMLGRQRAASSYAFGDYVSSYMQDYGQSDSFDSFVYEIYVDNY